VFSWFTFFFLLDGWDLVLCKWASTNELWGESAEGLEQYRKARIKNNARNVKHLYPARILECRVVLWICKPKHQETTGLHIRARQALHSFLA
jgi:hypothetical protein